MTIFLWCLGIYLAGAVIVGGFAWWSGHFNADRSLLSLALLWPSWLIGIAGAVFYDRYR